MAGRVAKPCGKFGCRTLVPLGHVYCAAHERKEVVARGQRYDLSRGSAHARGYDAQWAAFAQWWKRLHPLCAWCEERDVVVQGNQVDHIVPLVDAPERKYDHDNVQTLCRVDHTKKTVAEREARLQGRDLATNPITRHDVDK